MNVTLTEHEIWVAIRVGCERNLRNHLERRRDAHNLVSAGWDEHITGALGELAVARALGLDWNTMSFAHRHDGDVGGFEVRATLHDDGHLIVYRDDPDHRWFYLVTGRPPALEVHGSIMGSRAKDDRWWNRRARDPSYWIPQDALHPITRARTG